MAPDSHNSETSRPSGRMRLAAALGGAGVLAVGLGSGVLQAQSDGADAGPVGESALGTAQQPAATTATPVAEEAPNPNVSSTPLASPTPDAGGATDAVAGDDHDHEHAAEAAAPAEAASAPATKNETAPATTTPAAPPGEQPAAPAAEQAAAPAGAAPPVDPAAATPAATTPATPPAEAATEEQEPLPGCDDGEEEVMTLQGDGDEIVCVPEGSE